MAGIRRLSGDSIVAPAFPVSTVAGDSRTLHLALDQAPPGCVLVVDAEGFMDRAVWGEILTHSAIRAGVTGLVVDGVVRDLDGIRSLGFPVFGRGTNPAGPHKGWVGTIGQRISCGGVSVAAGDLVIGDSDGVVVVPEERIPDLLPSCEQRMANEAAWIEQIRAGIPSSLLLGLREAD
jgi:regulator of RNase E activity RraA